MEKIFHGKLLPAERIIWQGEPAKSFILEAQDIIQIPFSLMWCGFAVFWTIKAGEAGASPFFLLWGGMFICIGLYIVVGRFLVDAWARQRTHYAVTDRRVLIERHPPFANFTAIDLFHLPNLNLSERRNGQGTIRFGEAASRRRSGGEAPPRFAAITDVRRVFDLLQRSSRR